MTIQMFQTAGRGLIGVAIAGLALGLAVNTKGAIACDMVNFMQDASGRCINLDHFDPRLRQAESARRAERHNSSGPSILPNGEINLANIQQVEGRMRYLDGGLRQVVIVLSNSGNEPVPAPTVWYSVMHGEEEFYEGVIMAENPIPARGQLRITNNIFSDVFMRPNPAAMIGITNLDVVVTDVY